MSETPETVGHEAIDGALARLAELDGRDVSEHPAEFEHLHRVLRDALANPTT